MPTDDDDDRPKKRPWDGKKDSTNRDDDRPKKRRRDEEEADDDRPRKRRRDDDDDDDDRPRKRRRDDDDDDDFDDRPRRRSGATAPTNGLAVASLVLGVLALCTGPLCGIPALICGALAFTKPGGRGAAIGGLVLGGLFSVGIPLLLYPAMSRVRDSAARMKDANNMKLIGLGLHNDHDRTMGWSQFARDQRGQVKPGLSFRVGLLPYIEQENLYRGFDMEQPWDGPKNQLLSNTPLKTYTSPYENGEQASTNTPYRVFYGGGAVFSEDGKPASLMTITDGTSNTIMMVHATAQVPWAQPLELRYRPNEPVPLLGQKEAKGFNATFADGSVRFINNTIPERTLRLLITKADGEVIPQGGW